MSAHSKEAMTAKPDATETRPDLEMIVSRFDARYHSNAILSTSEIDAWDAARYALLLEHRATQLADIVNSAMLLILRYTRHDTECEALQGVACACGLQAARSALSSKALASVPKEKT